MASSNFRFSGVERSDIRPAPMMPEPGWHHYALVWDVNGVDLPEKASAAVFLDGKLVLQTPFVPDWKGPANVIAGATLFFPNREDEMPGYSRRDYAIDDSVRQEDSQRCQPSQECCDRQAEALKSG